MLDSSYCSRLCDILLHYKREKKIINLSNQVAFHSAVSFMCFVIGVQHRKSRIADVDFEGIRQEINIFFFFHFAFIALFQCCALYLACFSVNWVIMKLILRIHLQAL